MKMFALFALLMSSVSFASMDPSEVHDERVPSKKLKIQRGCFKEVASLGCGHPREDQTLFRTCLEEKKDELSEDCKPFFKKLYERKD